MTTSRDSNEGIMLRRGKGTRSFEQTLLPIVQKPENTSRAHSVWLYLRGRFSK